VPAKPRTPGTPPSLGGEQLADGDVITQHPADGATR